MHVAEDLNFDMTGILNQLLDVDSAIAEGPQGLAGSGVESLGQIFAPIDAAHAFTATASYGLEQAGRSFVLPARFLHAHVRTHRRAFLVRSYPALRSALAGRGIMHQAIHRA